MIKGITRVYTEIGESAHLVKDYEPLVMTQWALCGWKPGWPDHWHGSAPSDLPACELCEMKYREGNDNA